MNRSYIIKSYTLIKAMNAKEHFLKERKFSSILQFQKQNNEFFVLENYF